MKNIIKQIGLAMLFMAVVTSCNDSFLEDVGPIDRFGDEIYESETQLNNHVAVLYTYYFASFTSPDRSLVGEFTNMPSRLTEERGGGISDYPWIQNGTSYSLGDDCMFPSYYGPDRLSSSVTNYSYDRIRYVTDVIEKIDEYGTTLSEDFKNQVKGQMYYLRALQYYDLMKVYGGVPIVTTVQFATNEDPSTQIPRATTAALVDQILADFDEAAERLPAVWPNAAKDYGRPTSAAALAQKARVLLTFASPLFNPNWENSDRWQKVLDAGLEAETMLSGNGYGLYGSSAKDWEAMLNNSDYAAASNMEAIVVQLLDAPASGSSMAYQNAWENGLRLKSQGGTGGVAAPAEMIDLFPLADGERATPGNGYDSFHFFLNRDPRFYRTFAFNGVVWPYLEDKKSTLYTYMWQNGESNYFADDNDDLSSPVVVRKMSGNAAASSGNYALSGINIMEYRYAELLLIIAEAYAGVGDNAQCAAYINKVRDRVGAGDINTPSGKYAAFNACLFERQVELAYEGKRFWDMQRWMLFNDESDDAIAVNSTCRKIGVDPLKGGARHGYFLKCKASAGKEDPIDAETRVSANPDDADFDTQLAALADWYDANFEVADLTNYMDQYLEVENEFNWQNNYYINGLRSNLLTQNFWIQQTKGWESGTGAAGTYDWQAE
ncbi:MAG: RagB/SusD family nutrient uptake outer membrane protein [Mangrovibacterium sp.]